LQISPESDSNELLMARPDPDTPLVLPFFSGERSTGWAADARTIFSGVSAATTAAMLFRGTVESVALSYARIAEQLHSVAGETRQIVASGRVTQDLPALLQVLADVLQTQVSPVIMKRVTLRGTALISLDVLAPGADRLEPVVGDTRWPIKDRAPYYSARKQRFQDLYDAAVATPTNR
jgi:gluconokinase